MDRHREIAVPGCVNLRDVGGYVTGRGDTLAWGRLFRGAELPAGAEAAASLIAATRLSRVIDLRMEEEVRRAGAPVLPEGYAWIRLPLFETLRAHWPNPIDRTPASTAQRYFEMMEEGTPAITRIVELLSDLPARPTLIHCVAGRDRTGIVIACLLDLVDVPDHTIAADYALSSVVDDAEGRTANPANILLLLQLIRERFGSVREMLLAGGASASSIDRLHAALVE